MSEEAHSLIKVLALEAAGIRDGDGCWHGSDPVGSIAQRIAALDREDTEMQRKDRDGIRGNIWKVGNDDDGKGSHPLRLEHGHAWPSWATPPHESSLRAQDVELDGCDCATCHADADAAIPPF